ncbi:unnamed protein product, partial [Rotaria magnacalcarata]
ERTYIPLLNDATLLTNNFLMKLKRATGTQIVPKVVPKSGKSSTIKFEDLVNERRSFKSLAMVASIIKN